MGEKAAEVESAAGFGGKKRKAESSPPDGYVCRLCSIPGHWIQVCPTKKTGTKRQRKSKSDHVPVPGKDPSEEDIERAKELQAIPPPKCFCGLTSRLNKVKRSKEGGDSSRAIGKYFFFCSKKRDDETQCRFARPVEMEMKKQKRVSDKVNAKGGGIMGKSGNEVKKKEKMVCKFFAKNGTCKKGKKCEFSHDVQGGKAPNKASEEMKEREKEDIKKDNSDSSGSSSGDSSGASKGSGSHGDSSSSDSSSSSSDSSDSD